MEQNALSAISTFADLDELESPKSLSSSIYEDDDWDDDWDDDDDDD